MLATKWPNLSRAPAGTDGAAPRPHHTCQRPCASQPSRSLPRACTSRADRAWPSSTSTALPAMRPPRPADPHPGRPGRGPAWCSACRGGQKHNALDVTHNYTIDAPSVEKWVAANPPTGVDTREDTVFFINWWGRDDFVFHSYSKFGELDPDTGSDQFALFPSHYWGGTTADDEETGLGDLGTHRIWFHDLSAGPIFWDGSYNVDDRDLDGDGRADYRMPPTWEYLTPGGYRAATALTLDLARLARYVAVDLCFTASPAYPPYLTPDRLPDEINLDVNNFESIDGVDGSEEYLDLDYLVDELSELYRVPFSADSQDMALEGQAKECWEGWLYGDVCHGEEGNTSSFANLFYDAALKLDTFLDGPESTNGRYVYEAVAINYFDEAMIDAPYEGQADQNYRNGTQSFVNGFRSKEYADLYETGLTWDLIHEYGHHFGLSHPHDGRDPERQGELRPVGPLYFLWAGDQVNSVMSYVRINSDFSQFDRDNANRWFAAAYIRSAKNILGRVLTEGNGKTAAGVLL